VLLVLLSVICSKSRLSSVRPRFLRSGVLSSLSSSVTVPRCLANIRLRVSPPKSLPSPPRDASAHFLITYLSSVILFGTKNERRTFGFSHPLHPLHLLVGDGGLRGGGARYLEAHIAHILYTVEQHNTPIDWHLHQEVASIFSPVHRDNFLNPSPFFSFSFFTALGDSTFFLSLHVLSLNPSRTIFPPCFWIASTHLVGTELDIRIYVRIFAWPLSIGRSGLYQYIEIAA